MSPYQLLAMESLVGADLWSAPTQVGSKPPSASERMNFLREPDAGNPHVRFDERDVETEAPRATAPRLDSTVLIPCSRCRKIGEKEWLSRVFTDEIRIANDIIPTCRAFIWKPVFSANAARSA